MATAAVVAAIGRPGLASRQVEHVDEAARRNGDAELGPRPPRAGGGSDKRGSVNLMPVGMAVDGDGSTVVQGRVEHRRGQLQQPTSWRPSSSVRPSRRSCAPIPPSSPRPSSPGASSAA